MLIQKQESRENPASSEFSNIRSSVTFACCDCDRQILRVDDLGRRIKKGDVAMNSYLSFVPSLVIPVEGIFIVSSVGV